MGEVVGEKKGMVNLRHPGCLQFPRWEFSGAFFPCRMASCRRLLNLCIGFLSKGRAKELQCTPQYPVSRPERKKLAPQRSSSRPDAQPPAPRRTGVLLANCSRGLMSAPWPQSLSEPSSSRLGSPTSLARPLSFPALFHDEACALTLWEWVQFLGASAASNSVDAGLTTAALGNGTLNLKPQTLNPQPSTPNPKS